jgi:hypothetical protein
LRHQAEKFKLSTVSISGFDRRFGAGAAALYDLPASTAKVWILVLENIYYLAIVRSGL